MDITGADYTNSSGPTDVVIASASRVVCSRPGRVFIPSADVARYADLIAAARKIIFAAYSPSDCDPKASILAEVARELSARGQDKKTVFLSSDHVFDGVRGRYRATDVPAPVSPYGRAKARLESLLPRAKIIRFTVYGPSQNDKPLLLEMLQRQKTFDAIRDEFFSPVSTWTVNSAIDRALSENWRICHLAGQRISKGDWVREAVARERFPVALRDVNGTPSDFSLEASVS